MASAFPAWFEQAMQAVKTLHTLREGGKGESEDWTEFMKKAWTETTKDSIRDRYLVARDFI